MALEAQRALSDRFARRDFLKLSLGGSLGLSGVASAQTASLPHAGLITLGAAQHGKTTLSSAITKVLSAPGKTKFIPFAQINAPPLESVGKASMAVARVNFETTRRRYTLADCPHGRAYFKAMVAGKVQMDGAILVVSAADGPMPLTREHILLARQVSIPAMVVFMTKIELVKDKELLGLVELEVRELLSKYDFPGDDIPVIKGSALAAMTGKSIVDVGKSGQGDVRTATKSVQELTSAIDEYVPQPDRHLAHPLTPQTRFVAEAYVLTKEEGGRSGPFFANHHALFNFQMAEAAGVVSLPEGTEMVLPGRGVTMTVRLASPVPMGKGMRFTMRENDRTVGFGVVARIASE